MTQSSCSSPLSVPDADDKETARVLREQHALLEACASNRKTTSTSTTNAITATTTTTSDATFITTVTPFTTTTTTPTTNTTVKNDSSNSSDNNNNTQEDFLQRQQVLLEEIRSLPSSMPLTSTTDNKRLSSLPCLDESIMTAVTMAMAEDDSSWSPSTDPSTAEQSLKTVQMQQQYLWEQLKNQRSQQQGQDSADLDQKPPARPQHSLLQEASVATDATNATDATDASHQEKTEKTTTKNSTTSHSSNYQTLYEQQQEIVRRSSECVSAARATPEPASLNGTSNYNPVYRRNYDSAMSSITPNSSSEQHHWNDQAAKEQMDLVAAAAAAATTTTTTAQHTLVDDSYSSHHYNLSLSRSNSNNNDDDRERTIDPKHVRIERPPPPLRPLVKSSSSSFRANTVSASATTTTTTRTRTRTRTTTTSNATTTTRSDHNNNFDNDIVECNNGDMIVPAHDYIGAFYVSTTNHHHHHHRDNHHIDNGQATTPRQRPPSHRIVGPPPSHIQRQPSIDFSTLTQSIVSSTPTASSTTTTNSRRSVFYDEPSGSNSVITSCHSISTNTNSYTNANICRSFNEPDLPPIPATIVQQQSEHATTTNARVARVRISTMQQEVNNRNNNDDDDDGNNNSKKQQHLPSGYQKSTLVYVAGGICFVLVLGAIFLIVCFTIPAFAFVGLSNADNHNSANDNHSPGHSMDGSNTLVPTVATVAPTNSPTLAPTAVVIDLPEYTLQAIRNDPESAQAKAYRWIIQDLEWKDRPLSVIFQRYALVTLYYATNDVGGWNKKGWLDHNVDECDWVTIGNDESLVSGYRVCDPNTGLYEALDLAGDDLQGYRPKELALLSKLKFLDLQNNKFSNCQQCIPTELGLLSNLEHLNLYFSFTKGGIPSEMGQWTNMKTLELGQNRLISIPSEIGKLSKLERLDLSRNVLQGTLPSELSIPLSQKLYYFDIDRNFLTGAIPASFQGAIIARRAVNGSEGEIVAPNGLFFTARFTGNNFTGQVPDAMCLLQQRFKFDCDPQKLCGCDCTCYST